jgi:hypothetical protein
MCRAGSRWIVCLFVVAAMAGCQQAARKIGLKKSSHERFGWDARDYFGDPQVISLCHAIERSDILIRANSSPKFPSFPIRQKKVQ